jgi:hypothetical protein
VPIFGQAYGCTTNRLFVVASNAAFPWFPGYWGASGRRVHVRVAKLKKNSPLWRVARPGAHASPFRSAKYGFCQTQMPCRTGS